MYVLFWFLFLKFVFMVTSHHFVEPWALSVSDFGWLCPWVLVNSEFPSHGLIPILHLGMVKLLLQWPSNVTSRMAGPNPDICLLKWNVRVLQSVLIDMTLLRGKRYFIIVPANLQLSPTLQPGATTNPGHGTKIYARGDFKYIKWYILSSNF